MFLSSLFIVLGIVGVQPTEDVPVQQTVHSSGIRYEFVHQEQNYILDLNNQREVLAYYIDNVLQNPDLLPSTKGELLHYKTETKNDLVETFAEQRSRRRRREVGGGFGGLGSFKNPPKPVPIEIEIDLSPESIRMGGEKLMDAGGILYETGQPHAVIAGGTMAIGGGILSLFSDFWSWLLGN